MPTKTPSNRGWIRTGKIRIRTGWFGFAVIEELCEHIDETRIWRRVETSWRIPQDVSSVPTTGPGFAAGGFVPKSMRKPPPSRDD